MTGRQWVVTLGADQIKFAPLALSPDWQCQPFEGCARIYTQAQCTYQRHPEIAGAAILGTAFARHGPNRQPGDLDDATWQDLQRGSFQDVSARCWGSFVALVQHGERIQVFRDPSTAMPCLYARDSGAIWIGSSVGAMMAAGLRKPAVAMDQIARSLFRVDLPSSETALLGVHELLPGDCLCIEGESLGVSQIWSPWRFTTVDEKVDFAEQAERLQRAVENSARALGNAHGRFMVGVSGGLDSSIVAACLARRTPAPVCLTIATDDAEGDERPYARQLCDHLGLALQEARYDIADIDIEVAARPDLPRPTGRLIAQAYNAAASRAANSAQVRAFFTGNGGDNVFAFSQSAGAVADQLIHDGFGGRAWQTACDICRLTGCSLVQAWASALRIVSKPRRYQWRPNQGFLSLDVLRTLQSEPLEHPWLDAPKGALPGKAAHIAALLRIQRHLDGTGLLGAVEVVNPLMTQPVIETCLAIPSWMWCQGGRNRSVARQAFRGRLPGTITDRVSKGGPGGFGGRIIREFRNRIKERLLDGDLARASVIDRAALERRLQDERPNWEIDQVRVLELLEAEAWLGHWRSG